MPDTKKIVDKAWNFAHVLRDDGLSYMAYVGQITFLLLPKKRPPCSKNETSQTRIEVYIRWIKKNQLEPKGAGRLIQKAER